MSMQNIAVKNHFSVQIRYALDQTIKFKPKHSNIDLIHYFNYKFD